MQKNQMQSKEINVKPETIQYADNSKAQNLKTDLTRSIFRSYELHPAVSPLSYSLDHQVVPTTRQHQDINQTTTESDQNLIIIDPTGHPNLSTAYATN